MNITPDDLAKVRAKLPVSKSTLAANQPKTAAQINLPQCGQVVCAPQFRNMWDHEPPVMKGKRIRQNGKPLLNKLEQEWFDIVSAQFANYPRPRAQAKTYRLANGSRYTPDVTASLWPRSGARYSDGSVVALGPDRETAWEVKGPRVWDGSLDKLKFAAHEWREVRWLLVWKVKGEWKQQEILA